VLNLAGLDFWRQFRTRLSSTLSCLETYMKIRLSTLLFVIAVIAISHAWYVDRTALNHTKPEGVWYYPTNDIAMLGYTSELSILTDGSYAKRQTYRTFSQIHEGEWAICDDGRLVFNVTSVTDTFDGGSPQKHAMDARYICRWAIDRSGYLLLDAHEEWCRRDQEYHEIQWETHARETNFKRRYGATDALQQQGAG